MIRLNWCVHSHQDVLFCYWFWRSTWTLAHTRSSVYNSTQAAFVQARAFTKHLYVLRRSLLIRISTMQQIFDTLNPTQCWCIALTAKLTNSQSHLCSSFLPVVYLCCFVYSYFFYPCWRNTLLGIKTCEAFSRLWRKPAVYEKTRFRREETRVDSLWHTRRITNG